MTAQLPARTGGLAMAVFLLCAAPAAMAQQIVLTNSRAIDFGRFVAATGGTITVSPTGARTRTGGVVLLNSPSAGAAVFNVGKSNGGATNKAVAITLPANGSVRMTSGSQQHAAERLRHVPGKHTHGAEWRRDAVGGRHHDGVAKPAARQLHGVDPAHRQFSVSKKKVPMSFSTLATVPAPSCWPLSWFSCSRPGPN